MNPKLLFAGTEFGLWFTIDGGQKWLQLKGGDFPVIAVHDLQIQKRESDLVVGTFGRSIYILDDYSPLRTVTPEQLNQDVLTYPAKNSLMYIQTRPIGGRNKGFRGRLVHRRKSALRLRLHLLSERKAEDEKRNPPGRRERSDEGQ